MSLKNRSVIRTSSYEETFDDFPTAPWAVRAFLRYVVPDLSPRDGNVLEPACGRGHISNTLRESGFEVRESDIRSYGNHSLADYTDRSGLYAPYDFMITNPPFRQSGPFVTRALDEASKGVGVVVRTIWLESSVRFNTMFSIRPPTTVAVFSKRLQAAKGRVVKTGGGCTSHAWFWWDKRDPTLYGNTKLIWIPPQAQSELERREDYE